MRNLPTSSRSARVTLEQLPPSKRAFVVAYLANIDAGNFGQGSAPDAVQAAGISPTNRNAARVRASEFMRDPEVLAALRDELTRKLDAGAAIGVAQLKHLAIHAASEKVRLQASVELINRSSLGPVISRTASLHAHTSIEDLLHQLDGGSGEVATGDVLEAAFRDVTLNPTVRGDVYWGPASPEPYDEPDDV